MFSVMIYIQIQQQPWWSTEWLDGMRLKGMSDERQSRPTFVSMV